MTESGRVFIECPNCAADIVLERAAGGGSGPGGFVLKCSHCDHVFHFHLESDVSGAHAAGGAELLEVYSDERENKTEVLKRHGLSAEA